VPLHVARRNGIAPGAEATVSLLAEGIHLMLRTNEQKDHHARGG